MPAEAQVSLERQAALRAALAGERTPKFLATRDGAGQPNVVPCISLMPAGEGTDLADVVHFGNFLLRKSLVNLAQDRRVGVTAITEQLRSFSLTGDLVEFQRRGPFVERQQQSPLLRYNAYTGVRDAGVIKLRRVVCEHADSVAALLLRSARARWRGGAARCAGEVALPRAVRRELARIDAIKVLAWVAEDGYPLAVPALALQPGGARQLVCCLAPRVPAPPAGAAVAANVLTRQAISYQVKGVWHAGSGAIGVTEVYAGGPPLPGARIA